MQVGEEDILSLVAEDERRTEMIRGEYDPLTGVGCYGYKKDGLEEPPGGWREKVEIPDFFIPVMWIPKECLRNTLYQLVLRHGTIKDFIHNYQKREYTDSRAQLVSMELCKVRMREDPEFALFVCDRITDKQTGEQIPFRLNYPQRKLLGVFEQMRQSGKAIRVIILKARQWGGSTLTQLYIKWMQCFRHNGWNAIVLAQVKATSKKIKAMYRKSLESQPGWTLGYPGSKLQFSPYEGSTDDFILTDGLRKLRTSTLSVASFDNFDNVRGDNFHCAHYSEVAYWKSTPGHNPEGVIASVSGGIKDQADNIEVFESTGKGASGFFYEMCQMAMNGDSSYRFVFIPCFIIENDMEEVEDRHAFAEWLLKNRKRESSPAGYKESGKFFWRMWQLGASFDAINWYRNYRNKFLTHAFMASEAPIDEVEAFRNSGKLVFDPYYIDEMQEKYREDNFRWADIDMAYTKDSSSFHEAKIRYRDDGEGEMKVWAVNNNHIMRVKNRYVVAVDIGGAGQKSDFTVMTVIDRMGTIPGVGGKPAVAARWRGHLRHDLLAWKAAALAHLYSDALLVIESNTADRERYSNTEGDHFGTIIEEISDWYPNLYQRMSSPENVRDRMEMRYGFHTNKLTKQWLIDNLIACVNDQLWEEPDGEMYHELRIYERKEDGGMGNIEGKGNHDDVLMSTAVALWVSMNDMNAASWMRRDEHKRLVLPSTEAVI